MGAYWLLSRRSVALLCSLCFAQILTMGLRDWYVLWFDCQTVYNLPIVICYICIVVMCSSVVFLAILCGLARLWVHHFSVGFRTERGPEGAPRHLFRPPGRDTTLTLHLGPEVFLYLMWLELLQGVSLGQGSVNVFCAKFLFSCASCSLFYTYVIIVRSILCLCNHCFCIFYTRVGARASHGSKIKD